MSVKAIVEFNSFEAVEGDETKFSLTCNIVAGAQKHNNLDPGATWSLDALGSTVNSDVRAFAKDYASENMGVTFGLLDTVHVLTPVSLT